MKPLKTKAQIRVEIAQQVNEFLNKGGAVDTISPGVSGRDPSTQALVPPTLSQNKGPRTPVPDIIANIEARRKPKKTKKSKLSKNPKKKLILDDFGQPLRWEWADE